MKHWGDCNIYRADYPYCDCGLMRQLMSEDNPSELYPNYDRDLETEWGWKRDLEYPMPEPIPKTPEEIAECKRMLENIRLGMTKLNQVVPT